MSTATHSTVNIAPRRKRLLPRKPDDYDNELHGWDDPIAVDDYPWADEDCLDSYTIFKQNAKYAVPPAADTWHDSPAATQLAAMSKCGVWIPQWIATLAQHPARAFLLSWLLSLFEAGVPKNKKDVPLCRARAIDENGNRWWRTTRRRIVAETLLEESAADRARVWLEKHNLIFCDSSNSGLFLQPSAKSLMEGYYRLTDDAEVEDELKNLSGEVGWFGCHTQQRAKLASKGVFVHDALLILCDHKPGPALVLADALYWHSLNKEGESRARITRHGKLWVARSQRDFSNSIGGDRAALAGYVQWLTDRGYLVVEPTRWAFDRKRDYGRPTLHLRPCPRRIGEALTSRQAEIVRAIQLKQSFLSPTS